MNKFLIRISHGFFFFPKENHWRTSFKSLIHESLPFLKETFANVQYYAWGNSEKRFHLVADPEERLEEGGKSRIFKLLNFFFSLTHENEAKKTSFLVLFFFGWRWGGGREVYLSPGSTTSIVHSAFKDIL